MSILVVAESPSYFNNNQQLARNVVYLNPVNRGFAGGLWNKPQAVSKPEVSNKKEIEVKAEV